MSSSAPVVTSNTTVLTRNLDVAPASGTSTIDYLIANLPQTEIVKLLQDRDPNAILLLRTINVNPALTLTITKAVSAELGLAVHDDETAIRALKEIKAFLPQQGKAGLHDTIDKLIVFAEADLDDEIDLEGITDIFPLLSFLRSNARLAILCEETFAYLLQTIIPLTEDEMNGTTPEL